jgi:hypothetical protein
MSKVKLALLETLKQAFCGYITQSNFCFFNFLLTKNNYNIKNEPFWPEEFTGYSLIISFQEIYPPKGFTFEFKIQK